MARVTGAASAELSPQLVERIGRRSAHVDDEVALSCWSPQTHAPSPDRSSLERVEDTEFWCRRRV